MDEHGFRCDHCGEVIGVYEPMIVIVDGAPVHTSRAAARGAVGDGRRFHGTCYRRARATDELTVD